MQPVGLLGGTSWVSTQHYYAKLNQRYQQAMGGLASAPMLIHSVDFAPIAKLQADGRWDELGEILATNAQGLERAGAGAIAIGANTMHLCFDAVQSAVDIPVLHIADGIARAIGDQPTQLLGTGYTMQSDVLTAPLAAAGCNIHLPPPNDQADIHRIIFDELCHNKVTDSSRNFFADLHANFEGLTLLACTELGLVLEGDRVIDSLDCHVDIMLENILITKTYS